MEEEEKRDKKKNLWLREETAAAVDGRERAEAAQKGFLVVGTGEREQRQRGFLSLSLSPLFGLGFVC